MDREEIIRQLEVAERLNNSSDPIDGLLRGLLLDRLRRARREDEQLQSVRMPVGYH